MLAPQSIRQFLDRLAARNVRHIAYCAAVVTIAAVLIGVTICGSRGGVYEAQLQVRREAPAGSGSTNTPAAYSPVEPGGTSELTVEELRTRLLRAPAVQRLVRSYPSSMPTAKQPGQDESASNPNVNLESSGRPGGPTTYVVRARAATPHEAIVLANVAGTELIRIADQPHDRQVSRRAHFARWEVRELRHYERLARQQLESFLTDWRPAEPALASQPETTVASSSPSVAEQQRRSALTETPPPVENPQWRRIQDEIAQLQDDLQQALTRLQPQHPEIRQREMALRQRQRELAVLPRFVPTVATSSEPVEPSHADSLPSTSPPDLGDPRNQAADSSWPGDESVSVASHDAEAESHEATLNELETLRSNYLQAVTRREEAELGLEAVLEPRLSSASTVRTWHKIGSRGTSRVGNHVPRNRLVVVLLLGAACGAAAVGLAGLQGRRSTFEDRLDVEAALSLPVVVQLTSEADTVVEGSGGSIGPAARWLSRLAECVIGAYLFVLLVLLVAQSPVAMELATDPLVTVAELPLRVWNALHSAG